MNFENLYPILYEISQQKSCNYARQGPTSQGSGTATDYRALTGTLAISTGYVHCKIKAYKLVAR